MFQIPIEPLFVFVIVLVRVSFFFFFLPVFGELFLPARVRILLSAAVALVFTPLLFSRSLVFPETLPQFLALLLPEALLGFAFGLVGRILFGTIQYAGQLMGHEIGFGMATQIDPAQGVEVPVVSQMLFVCSLLAFFAVNAHHLFFQALALSFDQAPPGFLRLAGGLNAFFVEQGARMFAVAVQLALPVIGVIFVVNIAMGMIVKGVPQIQVFFERFPIAIIVGLFMMSAVIGLLVRIMTGMFDRAGEDLLRLLALLGG